MSDVLNYRQISRDLVSASVGSVLCCYTGQPFDTVKVRMQTRPSEFSGVMSSTRQIINQEGVVALWKGAVPTAGGMILENCMAFGINAALKRAFPDDLSTTTTSGPPSLYKPFMMGAITGCCSATVLLPSEIIKAKTQVEISNISSQEILKTMMKRQGVRSLFVGTFVNALY
jgi:solute carrier family 25 (mitochondrial carnitine/acylcarnitine transporter), member 20/29